MPGTPDLKPDDKNRLIKPKMNVFAPNAQMAARAKKLEKDIIESITWFHNWMPAGCMIEIVYPPAKVLIKGQKQGDQGNKMFLMKPSFGMSVVADGPPEKTQGRPDVPDAEPPVEPPRAPDSPEPQGSG